MINVRYVTALGSALRLHRQAQDWPRGGERWPTGAVETSAEIALSARENGGDGWTRDDPRSADERAAHVAAAAAAAAAWIAPGGPGDRDAAARAALDARRASIRELDARRTAARNRRST